MIRVYYWLAGVAADRPGGPWWVKCFHTGTHGSEVLAVNRFVSDLADHVEALGVVDGYVEAWPEQLIVPPPAGVRWHVGGDREVRASVLALSLRDARDLFATGWTSDDLFKLVMGEAPGA